MSNLAAPLSHAPAPSKTSPLEDRLRTSAHEHEDHQALVENLKRGAFEDWPNEAGFDGLDEERGPIEIPVTGTIPAWAAGNLYRTGPGQCKVEDTANGKTHYLSHWFDGLAHTHRFEIVHEASSTRVFYSSRRQSEGVAATIRAGNAAKLYTFAQRSDPCIGLLSKFMSTFRAVAYGRGPRTDDEDNVNVSIIADLPVVSRDASPDATGATLDGREPTLKAPSAAGHRALSRSLWVTTDASVMRRVDPATLEPIGMTVQSMLHPELKGPMSSAHAQRDPETGDVYNFNLVLGAKPTYRIFRLVAATGCVDILAEIQCGATGSGAARPAYLHSFFLTSQYVVLCLPSSTHIAYNGLRMLWEHNFVDGLEGDIADGRQTRWIVVDRRPGRSGVVAEFDSDPGFFFHSVNAFDAPDPASGRPSIVCDRIDYAGFDIIRSFYYDVLLNRTGAASAFYGDDPARTLRLTASLSRYRLVLPEESDADTPRPSVYRSAPATAVAECLWSIPAPHAGELPTIDPRCATRQHRFVYSLISRGLSTLSDTLCKTDTADRSALLWAAPRGHTPSEAIFVPRPDGTAEDDGVLLTVVLDGVARTSYLLCLDARTMAEMGRAAVGRIVGLGFHGTFV